MAVASMVVVEVVVAALSCWWWSWLRCKLALVVAGLVVVLVLWLSCQC